jgi:hypothetical protein
MYFTHCIQECTPTDTIPDEPVLGPAYGTVTATNAGNVPAILAGLICIFTVARYNSIYSSLFKSQM